MKKKDCNPKSLKIGVWGSLGALWDPSWPPGGAGATTRPQQIETCRFFGSPGSLKWNTNRCKIKLKFVWFFYIDFGTTFYRSWDDFGPKNLSKMTSLRGVSILLLICWKCDFERQHNDFAVFFSLGEMIFNLKRLLFHMFYRNWFRDLLFLDLGSILARNWRPNETQIR